MEHRQQDNNGWVNDAERWIGQIQGVRQCKIDLDTAGEVTGVHVIATSDRDPRHVVRDVEGLLKARLSLDVYYKKIGVVQIVESPEDAPEKRTAGSSPQPEAKVAEPKIAEPEITKPERPAVPVEILDNIIQPAMLVEDTSQIRMECTKVGIAASGPVLTATVELKLGTAAAESTETGPDHPELDISLLARATLGAIVQLIEDPVTLSLAEVRKLTLGNEDVIVAAVDLVEGRRSERYHGICSQKHNRQQAAVYAVLDALNRRLALMNLREGALTQ
jgi:hypothetical protein